MFTGKEQLARALGLVLISAPSGVPPMTDGEIVTNDRDARCLAQAMLVRAGVEHDRAAVERLATLLRSLIRKETRQEISVKIAG